MDLFHEQFGPVIGPLESKTESHLFNFTQENSRLTSESQLRPRELTWSSILLLVALCIVAVWVFVANSLAIYGILTKPEHERRATDFYYINVTAIDVLDGCLTLPVMGSGLVYGDFLLASRWCHVWIFVDYTLIIGSAIGFMFLLLNYFWMVRRPIEYKNISQGRHQLLIFFGWVIAVFIWIPAFVNNYFINSVHGSCGFSIHINHYYTLYIAIVGYYVPLIICIVSGAYSNVVLRWEAHDRLFYAVRKPNDAKKGWDDVGGGGIPPLRLTRDWSLHVIFETNHILKCQRHAKKELPLALSLLALFTLSRTIYYAYFGIGAFVTSIFPRDLSNSVYWILQVQGCFSPVIHFLLDDELRRLLSRNLCNSGKRKRWAKANKHLLTMPINNNTIITVKPILVGK